MYSVCTGIYVIYYIPIYLSAKLGHLHYEYIFYACKNDFYQRRLEKRKKNSIP
jgi:hypothetical protein